MRTHEEADNVGNMAFLWGNEEYRDVVWLTSAAMLRSWGKECGGALIPSLISQSRVIRIPRICKYFKTIVRTEEPY